MGTQHLEVVAPSRGAEEERLEPDLEAGRDALAAYGASVLGLLDRDETVHDLRTLHLGAWRMDGRLEAAPTAVDTGAEVRWLALCRAEDLRALARADCGWESERFTVPVCGRCECTADASPRDVVWDVLARRGAEALAEEMAGYSADFTLADLLALRPESWLLSVQEVASWRSALLELLNSHSPAVPES